MRPNVSKKPRKKKRNRDLKKRSSQIYCLSKSASHACVTLTAPFTALHSVKLSDDLHIQAIRLLTSSCWIGLSAQMISHRSSSSPPPSPSVWVLLSLLVDVIAPLCSHFVMAILHFPGWPHLPVSPSARHVNVFFCLLLSIRFNLNWELGMWNGMSETEPYLSASSNLPPNSPTSLHVTPRTPVN